MLKKGILLIAFSIMLASMAAMAMAIREAAVREDGMHKIVAQCMEGYAVASFLHGGSWSFAQAFSRDADGSLRPVRCGSGPFNLDHWRK